MTLSNLRRYGYTNINGYAKRMVKAAMRKSLFFKMIGIVVGTLLLSLLFVG